MVFCTWCVHVCVSIKTIMMIIGFGYVCVCVLYYTWTERNRTRVHSKQFPTPKYNSQQNWVTAQTDRSKSLSVSDEHNSVFLRNVLRVWWSQITLTSSLWIDNTPFPKTERTLEWLWNSIIFKWEDHSQSHW